MKYYFITYQAENYRGSTSTWNQVIEDSPMKFIKHVSDVEERGSKTYHNFVVINTCEISKDEYDEYHGQF